MLNDNPLAFLKDNLGKAELHISRAQRVRDKIEEWDTISPAVFLDVEKAKTLDSFIYRFIKLQDLIGQKLFKSYLDAVGEFADDMSFLDVLDKLEKLKVIKSVDQWFAFRRLRNQLTDP